MTAIIALGFNGSSMKSVSIMNLPLFEIASLMSDLDAGIDGITPCVSSGVTHGGDECLITFPTSNPASLANDDRSLSV